MATLKDVVIKFKCSYCESVASMTAEDIMEAGVEGPPYCSCTNDDPYLDVIGVHLLK